MPKNLKVGGKDWKPGESGNLDGRPKIPDDIKEARKLNRITFERISNKYIWMTEAEIKAARKDPGTPMVDQAIISLLLKGIATGCHLRLNFILDRLIGKVKDEVEFTVHPKPQIIKRLDGSEIILTTEAQLLDCPDEHLDPV